MVPSRIPIVELFLAKGAVIFGFSCVYFHVIFHLLFPCKGFITCRTFVWFLVQVNSLDVLIQYCHFVISVSTEGAHMIFRYRDFQVRPFHVIVQFNVAAGPILTVFVRAGLSVVILLALA